jgi:DNA modification methylase
MKQKLPRYEIHKYWGKKPSKDLIELINKYSNMGDVVLDPFAGYGVFVCESYLNGRNAIGNDLNPASTFIQRQILNSNINLSEFKNEIDKILIDLEELSNYWYGEECPQCNSTATVVSTLRSKDNNPFRYKIKCHCSKKAIECEMPKISINKILKKEKECLLPKHPSSKLIQNSRISAIDGMKTDDLFTIRALKCHSILMEKINCIDNIDVKNLAKLTFTSNLANCSRLVPPIKSRGQMSPGAWMTGFYIGENYIENNVFHYFRNRVKKAIAGKADFLHNKKKFETLQDKKELKEFKDIDKKKYGYLITQQDTKSLSFPDNSIDYIFTDPPYGDSVPYFEQSILWNTWLGNQVDYKNEVVISDSKKRDKNLKNFNKDISLCLLEIYRVLKTEKFFSLTFHSVSGREWHALTSACLLAGFSIHNIKWLTQKTFSPRQLNRIKSVKGDLLITFKKETSKPKITMLNKAETKNVLIKIVTKEIKKSNKDTNYLLIELLKYFFKNHIVFDDVNFIKIISDNFKINDKGFWIESSD